MLHNATTAYILAGILVFIIGLIIFCCCRIWYDLLGCGESRRRRNRNPDGIVITDNEESRFKPESSEVRGDFGGRSSTAPVMRIVITKAESDEQDDEDQVTNIA